MRDDRQNLGDDLVDSNAWENRDQRFSRSYHVIEGEDGKPEARVHPFSAGERNGFFANVGGNYVDVSPISGVDSKADSRSFVYFDYDGDGDHDVALINANTPSLELWRTEVAQPGNFLKVQLEGGAVPGDESGWSNRSAIGAVVVVTAPSGLRQTKELHAGEGFGSQNSKTLVFGLGSEQETNGIEVRWPSGRKTRLPGLKPAGTLLRIRERE